MATYKISQFVQTWGNCTNIYHKDAGIRWELKGLKFAAAFSFVRYSMHIVKLNKVSAGYREITNFMGLPKAEVSTLTDLQMWLQENQLKENYPEMYYVCHPRLSQQNDRKI